MIRLCTSFKINLIALLISLTILILPICFYLEMNFQTSFVQYWDEIITFFSTIYCFYLFFTSRLNKINKSIIVLTVLMTLLGLVSNLTSNITHNYFSIATDIIALFKVVMPFIAAIHIGINDKNKNVAKYLMPFSKILIISSFIFGTISLFFDIGMAGEKRYGIPAFCFIFNNGPCLGLIVASSLLIVLICEENKNIKLFYEFCAILVLIYTTKGSIYPIFIVYFVLLFLWRKKQKISFLTLLPASILILLASSYQIQTYLSSVDTPRMTLIKYGFVTANKFFPLGSGFSTYGSAEAAKYYSPLYYSYGFENVWGLSEDYPMFLNDCYIAMIIGQFGYLGTVLFALILVLFLKLINSCNNENKKAKAFAFGMFFSILIAGIGLALIKSSMGVLAMIILGLFVGYYQPRIDNNDIPPQTLSNNL